MDAVELLEKQHREVEKLFEEFEQAGDRAYRTKEQLFVRIADQLALHTRLEEELVYPVAAELDEDLVREAVEEHLSVKRLIADLLDLKPDDDAFHAKVLVMKEQVEHHVEEEEEELFPELRKSELDLDELGEKLTLRMRELEEEEAPRRSIPAETAEAAPIE